MFKAGQTFCGYSIIKPLGNRRAIENYHARRLASGAPVRLTILDDELLPGETDRKKFISAADRIHTIEHPGIARLLEVGMEDGRVYYVSEFYPGGNLKQLLNKRLLPGRALRLVRDVSQSLDLLHGAGINHGNLKPGNILLGPEDRAILTDVGMSKLLKLNFNLGIDPYYVSPEQVRGALPEAGSDLYSLGIVLYQLLCGQLPFQADSDFRIAMLRLDEPIPRLPDDYLFIQPLLERMLEVEVQARLSCTELLEELESLIVAADAAEFDTQNLTVKQQGDDLMNKESGDSPATDIATRIEETLTEREQQRLSEEPVSIEISDPERSPDKNSYFSYLMLLFGVVLGAVIGAAFYFVLPGSGPQEVSGRARIETIKGLDDADRLLLAGKTEKARKAYLSIVARNPDSPRPYNNLASLYAAEGDLDQAQALLKKALETDPDYLAIYRNIGTVYASLARDSYGKALQMQGEKKQVRLQVLGQQQMVPLVAKTSQPQAVVSTVKADVPTVVTVKQKPPVKISEPPVKLLVSSKAAPAINKDDEEAPVRSAVVVRESEEKPPFSRAVVPVSPLSPQEFLQQWAKAWSAQDVDTYLAGYAPEYVPPNNQPRQAWQDKRRQRLKAPTFIEVNVETIESISGTGDTAEVQLIQGYQSDRYQDRTRKRFVLRRSGQSWLIVEERSLGRVR